MRRFHDMPFGARLAPGGTEFTLWAPSARAVRLWTPAGEYEMTDDGDGRYRVFVDGAAAGERYRYRIDGDRLVPDPASRFQPEDVEGPSEVVDPQAYEWSDADWRGRPWEEAVLYEVHVGTATPEGSFAALEAKLEGLQDLGITAVELMPIADFPGSRNWGYDGVLPFAPDHAYGTPEDLKRLIDRAHALGLMMVLDVVYNHFGPSGNYLPLYAGAFFTHRHETLWGAGINVDGDASATVRDFFVHNALYWLEEYHFDGLRLDAVHAIADDSPDPFLAELAERVRRALPDRQVHLVLENNANESRWLARRGASPGLYSAQWNDDLHHAWHSLLTGETEGYYRDYEDPVAHLGRCLAEGFAYQGEISRHEGGPRGAPSAHLPPSAFVAFLQNHDQIGNRAFGERLGRLTEPGKLALARAALLLSPQIALLFMGEEWDATAPFHYFVDFVDTALSTSVREGRRREFAGFGSFADETAQALIPDPTADASFAGSGLDWAEAGREPHRDILAQTRALLHRRQDAVVPLTRSGFKGASWSRPEPGVLDVRWDFAAGALRLVANFGAEAAELPVDSASETVWASAAVAIGERIGLPSWTGAVVAKPASAPRATYRLQFHAGFTFDDAAAIVSYLARLGISHVYASPIQQARPGSTHGYDIVDHAAINTELGGEAGFLRLSDTLQAHGLGLLLDIVPNHMGIGGADNAWWLSVIEWGRLSPHAVAFDIDWERFGAHEKLVLPFLGKRYGEALEAGELRLSFDPDTGGFNVRHWDHRFPVNPLTFPVILDRILMIVDAADPAFREVMAISARLRALAEEAAPAEGLVQAGEELKGRLARAAAESQDFRAATDRALALVNGAEGIPESFDTLHRILEMQSYRLAYWRVAASEINYRRFFDINTLAGIRVEEPEVFERTHALIFDLVAAGRVQGLRIDHIDGLADPAGYVRTLQQRVGPGFYVLAEKILGEHESLRPWPLAGTTGYDVLNLIDGVLLDRSAAAAFEAVYAEATGERAPYETQLHRVKREVLEASFASELEVVVSDLARIAAADRLTRDYTVHAMRRALAEIVAQIPVYRSYVVGRPDSEDRALIETTVAEAAARSTLPDHTVHVFVARILLGDGEVAAGSALVEHIARFRRRFQQLTGPVTAKSVEDTLFYRYVPLLALNEVGGEPGAFGVAPEAFHVANTERLRAWPHAMIATATHDTKRGEDGRARLLALSEMPGRWREQARLWQSLCDGLARPAPDANDRHMILQQLLASWPMALLDRDDPDACERFRERMLGWVEKALREAKRHTSWTNPREPYEAAARGLVTAALAPGSPALASLRPLARALAARGMVKGLARTVLKLTLPGVPDIYQGTEFWDLAMVDPDNRRPVDYAAAGQALAAEASVESLMASWRDGRIKQRLIHALLADRAASPRLYAEGSYRPVAIAGPRGEALLAFERVLGEEALFVLVARLTGLVEDDDETLPLAGHWDGSAVTLAQGHWHDVLTDRVVAAGDAEIPVGDLLSILPVVVLRRR